MSPATRSAARWRSRAASRTGHRTCYPAGWWPRTTDSRRRARHHTGRRTSCQRDCGHGTGDTSWPCGLASALAARTAFVSPTGQGEGERGSLAHVALDPDPPPVQLHELFGQRQPEPRALLLAHVVPADLAELLEDGRLVLGRDPDPRVAGGDRDAVVGRHG